MAKELMGLALTEFESPIQTALSEYEKISGGDLKLDKISASKLVLTPDKSNSARSKTQAHFRGQDIGDFFVIAFKNGDGTGSQVNHQLKDLAVSSPYPTSDRVVPRSKSGIYNEGHLVVVTHEIDNVHADPLLFSGSFDLLGLRENTVQKIATLGHLSVIPNSSPKTTLTVGYDDENNRFGDPHAVFSNIPNTIQVCAFLSIGDKVADSYGDILTCLKPQPPAEAS